MYALSPFGGKGGGGGGGEGSPRTTKFKTRRIETIVPEVSCPLT